MPRLLVLTVTLAVLGMFASSPATASPLPPRPIGWDVYRHLDRLPELNPDESTAQFASTDPTGQNNDFWDGPQRCLGLALGQCIIAQHAGPGEIDGIWFTWHDGDVRSVGIITIVLDGIPVVHAPLQDLVDGKVGGPFRYPLVGNADQSSGGVYIAVPMPFHFGMVVTTESSSFYYHVTYRTFTDAAGVPTFNPFDPADDVVANLAAAGTRDPKPPVPEAHTIDSPTLTVAPAGAAVAAELTGPGTVRAIRLQLPHAGTVTPSIVTAGGRAFGPGGSSTFAMRIDPNNSGIRLTRRLDPGITRQVADVTVNGVPVGRWASNVPEFDTHSALQPQAQLTGTAEWLDESVDIPASITAHQSQLTITNHFMSSDVDFNEFGYWVDDRIGASSVRTDTLEIGSHDAETAHGYRIIGQTWNGTRTFEYPLNTQQSATQAQARELLTALRLRITFDGRTTVDSPVGEFFGTGFGVAPVKSLMFAVDPATGWYSAWWPMPYAARAVVELYNTSTTPVVGVRAHITSAPDPAVPSALAAGQIGYFHTTSTAGPTVAGQDWTYLRTGGTGKFVGNVVQMTGPANRAYLEGNEHVRIDGAPIRQIDGTGTEDYYESGWYFNRGPYNSPLHGNTAHLTAHSGCLPAADCTAAYRLWLADPVPFHHDIDFGIQHGPANDIPAHYSTTAFWYAR